MTGLPRRPASTRRIAPASRRRASRRERTAPEVGVRRIRWALAVYLLLVLVVVGQLVNIQLLRADEYADRGVRQRARTIELVATRGRIYDRQGQVLATSVQSATIYADPRAYLPGETDDGIPVPPAADPAEVAANLAPLLGRDAEVIEERLRQDAHFVYLARQLDHEVGEAVRDLDLPGIGVLVEPRRVYPAGGLAAQVVGFTGIDGEGLHGLEAQYDGILRGEPGMLAIERAPGGLDIASGVREVIPPTVGTDLVLTVNREIQHAAERAAAEAVDRYGAQGASVLVLDVSTREILAMASVPGFDPNRRTDTDRDAWRNRSVTDVFEPGSTQKALTVAAAIEAGLISGSTELVVPDRVTVSGKTFTDAYPHPEETWTVGEVLARSSNVGTIEIAERLGPARLDGALRRFGYGATTGSGLLGESPGMLMPHEQWWGTSLPTIAIGQGVAVTLLQLADAYATIANDGVAVAPRIVRGTVGEDGRLVTSPPGRSRQVLSPGTAREVRELLEQAVTGPHATGSRAAVPGYSVGGKTGTARKPDPERRGYTDEYVATFVGFAPVDEPRFVVAVMVDEPWPFYGGVVAAPVFAEVMEATLIAMRVPPETAGRSLEEAMRAAEQAAEGLNAGQEAGEEPSDGELATGTGD